MELLSPAQFKKWASPRNIVIERWGPSFKTRTEGDGRFWRAPKNAGGSPAFLDDILSAFGPWQACCIWPRDGKWMRGLNQNAWALHRVHQAILQGAGVPIGGRGALLAKAAEQSAVLTIAFAQLCFGVSQLDDLVLIPDHGRAIITINHHDSVSVQYSRQEDVARFTATLRAEGYKSGSYT
jgi:hypothetical protein